MLWYVGCFLIGVTIGMVLGALLSAAHEES